MYCELLLNEFNLHLVPSYPFGIEGYVRITYIPPLNIIKKSMNRLLLFDTWLRHNETKYNQKFKNRSINQSIIKNEGLIFMFWYLLQFFFFFGIVFFLG